MTDSEIAEEIAVAAGYGLAALSLQQALVKRLMSIGRMTSQDVVKTIADAQTISGSGSIGASQQAISAARNYLDAFSKNWKNPLPSA